MNNIYKNAKIIIIDDVEEVLRSTKNRLEFEDMNVECFKNPLEGLEYLRENPADVLLLDYFMPEMNGDEFVNELRKFNNETIIILQTGYADKVPPEEMLDSMKIQGYVDKLKGEEELVLMTKSAIKTAQLTGEIKKKESHIEKIEYKKSILGELITHLINDAKNQVFQISAVNQVLKMDEADLEKETQLIENAVQNIYALYKAINFENETKMTYEEYAQTIKYLLKVKTMLSGVKLDISLNEGITGIIDEPVNLVYVVLKALDYLMETQKEITMKVEHKKITLQVNDNTNSVIISKIKALNEDENLEISKDEKEVKFIFSK